MSRIKGIVFDVDGTLYSNSKLRFIIGSLLIANLIKSPVKFRKIIKIISAYRKAQEKLRENILNDARAEQIELTSKSTGYTTEDIEMVVSVWFDNKPLKYLKRTSREGLIGLFKWIKDRNLKLGLLSDYPCREKADALGITEHVDIILSAQDKEINVFKPDSKGFEVISEKLGLKPSEIIYIGDRSDIDVPGAVKSGMTAVIIGEKPGKDYLGIKNFKELQKIIEERI